MQAKRILWMILAALFLLGTADAIAKHGEKPPFKKAILLVAFGTSDPEATRAFELVEKRARERFPDVEMRNSTNFIRTPAFSARWPEVSSES